MRWGGEIESSFKRDQFPNVWLCRLFITAPAYSQLKLMNDYACLGIEALHNKIRLKFVTCDSPRVRRVGADDWEPESDDEP